MKSNVKKLTTLGMICAIAYVVMVFGRIPMISFLKYDPKDVIITISGFIYGPLSAFIVSAVVSLVEMVTVSDTGYYGLIMNIVSTCSFACVAALIYKIKRKFSGAVIGLIVSVVFMTGIMLLWNYFVTPHYLGQPQEAVAAMLLPVFMPFNLIKGSLNAAITLLLYKPIVTALRKAGLITQSEIKITQGKRKFITIGSVIASVFVIISLVMLVALIW